MVISLRFEPLNIPLRSFPNKQVAQLVLEKGVDGITWRPFSTVP